MIIVLAVIVIGAFVLAARASRSGRSVGAGVVAVLGVVVAFGLLTGVRGGGGSDVHEDEAPAVAILQPLDSTTITSPVTVEVTVERLGPFHLHLMVDAPCAEAGAVIPADGSHRHLAAGERQVTLELAPGEHTLCLQTGDAGHHARPETHEVTVLVQPKERT